MLFLLFVAAVLCLYLILNFENHDEITFSALLSFACGSTTIVISWFCQSLIKFPFSQKEDYGRQFLWCFTGFLGILVYVSYVNNLQSVTVFGAVTFFIFIYGLGIQREKRSSPWTKLE
eukprot:TRINITY_DN3480_c1_g1_i1.p1 TRINITY_DN3480_c1_g1~~TRINITY_DN3480_c1_g1_i1.p1  ORF type:complete len:118 (-),score=11.56 TRINITY_DN3480_c1_g1_i1:19-372(-)